jgi:hypothetical protein
VTGDVLMAGTDANVDIYLTDKAVSFCLLCFDFHHHLRSQLKLWIKKLIQPNYANEIGLFHYSGFCLYPSKSQDLTIKDP